MIKHQLPTIFDDFNEFFNAFNGCSSQDCCQNPRSEGISISEDEEKFYIDAPLPGIKSDEVEVTLDPKKRHLLIKGEGSFSREGATYRVKNSQNYSYVIPLSNEVNLDEAVDASSKDGILSITLSKNKENKPLKIDVKSK